MPSDRIIPTVRFLGLWDTVAAYGLPIDEMTRGVSQWLWPLEIPSHTLHPRGESGLPCLSLDDERTTFHPVLWNERNGNPQPGSPRFTKDERFLKSGLLESMQTLVAAIQTIHSRRYRCIG